MKLFDLQDMAHKWYWHHRGLKARGVPFTVQSMAHHWYRP